MDETAVASLVPAPTVALPPPVNVMHAMGFAAGGGLAASHIIMAAFAMAGYPIDQSLAADAVTLIAIGGAWLMHRNCTRNAK